MLSPPALQDFAVLKITDMSHRHITFPRLRARETAKFTRKSVTSSSPLAIHKVFFIKPQPLHCGSGAATTPVEFTAHMLTLYVSRSDPSSQPKPQNNPQKSTAFREASSGFKHQVESSCCASLFLLGSLRPLSSTGATEEGDSWHSGLRGREATPF